MILMVGVSLFISTQSLAEFDISRMTTVVDDFSGSYTVTKSGRLNESQFSGTSLTEFNDFHPGAGENEATVSGFISKQTNRSAGLLNTTAEGGFAIESNNGIWDVSFTGLIIEFSDSSAEIIGSVTVNGDVFDVGDLPAGVAKTLRRVFWLTRR